MESYLFSFQMMYKSQFQKIDPYDWFCAPGSQILSLFAKHLIAAEHHEQKSGGYIKTQLRAK